MKFNDGFIDQTLRIHLREAEARLDALYKIEEAYLTLRAAKDTKWAILFIKSPQGTVEQRKAWVHCHPEWAKFSETLAQAEAGYHKERHRYEVALKYIDAAHLSLKVERLAIERGVGG